MTIPPGGLVCRRAAPEDAAALLELSSSAGGDCAEEPGLLSDIGHPLSVWVVAEFCGSIVACASMRVEPAEHLGKIQRLHAVGEGPQRHARFSAVLSFLLELAGDEWRTEVVYSTGTTLSHKQQELARACGFRPSGVFPKDASRINGLAIRFLDGLLARKRHAGFSLHPAAMPFFKLAQAQFSLPPLEAAQRPVPADFSYDLPELELISAPRFVGERFRRLKARSSLSTNFYPFRQPNVLITSADQSVEIFAFLSRDIRFAGLLGERLMTMVDPVALYERVTVLLRKEGADYIEIINDAADTLGIECILRAGFAPCGYFPALRENGSARRDFVIFAKLPSGAVKPQAADGGIYAAFLEEFYKAVPLRQLQASQEN
ncbi:MAG: hypothetical protein WCW52_03350 [Elusimicrobiales bacterium]|jgi:hypothetical protein